MSGITNAQFTRRGLLGAFAATSISAAPVYAGIFGFLRKAGDYRSISLYSGRSGEMVNTVYWVDGAYIPEALAEISYAMRDLRNNKVKAIDNRTLDIMAAVHRMLDVSEPYTLLSGYRSQETNDALRRKGRRAAKNSLHIQGQAADLRLRTRSTTQLYQAAAQCKSGGVGKYARSNFVHMDCGAIRTWRG